jgi:nucleoside-diphosphate-sugar epimerase
MRKILITGNMGYVGPSVVRQLKESYPLAQIIGLDCGYFAHCLTNVSFLPETRLSQQIFADVRDIDASFLEHNGLSNVTDVVYLAAISNDVMGELNPSLTEDINWKSALRLARLVKANGAKSFTFASSCSVYGTGSTKAKIEKDEVVPLTAYAKSKIAAERDLKTVADDSFIVTALRFATACGMNDRLRLDLVLNDFVASAKAAGSIVILSDGSPWRPLIHVDDMGRAVAWAIGRNGQVEGNFLAINIGSNEWNTQIRDLAETVSKCLDGVKFEINTFATPDKRSYKVDFTLFKSLALPQFQPQVDLISAINGLSTGLDDITFFDTEFRNGQYMRINVLKRLKVMGMLTDDLRWY